MNEIELREPPLNVSAMLGVEDWHGHWKSNLIGTDLRAKVIDLENVALREHGMLT